MFIKKTQFINSDNTRSKLLSNNIKHRTVPTFMLSKITQSDTFQKSIQAAKFSNVTFTAGHRFVTHKFETTFTRAFFKKLLREHIPGAYTGIPMIPLEDIDALKSMKTLNKKSSIAIKYLKEYKESMFPIEKEIFIILENLSKKHPDKSLQELLKLKYNNAEKILITQQSKILNKINMMGRKLPKKEFYAMRELIQASFNKIFEPDPLPEDRFGRKEFIHKLDKLPISNKKLKEKMLNVAHTLPQSSDSINAFIVKYSQPYKIRTGENGKKIQIGRDSEELALRILEPSVATDEHIYPRSRYWAEEQAKLYDDNYTGEISDFRVTILTSRKFNEEKEDTLIDDFIKQKGPHIIENIQNHIKYLIEVEQKWAKSGKLADAAKLADYIKVLKNEFDLRSNLVKIDLGDFEEEIPRIKEKAELSIAKKEEKRLKKVASADNSHSERFTDNHGNILQNRKVQKHNARFNK